MKRHVSRGLTLIELMIVVAILSVLLAVAVPGFSNLILSNQMSSNASDFVDTLRRAKTEASTRLTTVTVCIRNGDTCNPNGTWDDGWLVFNGGTIIYEYEALNQQITFTATDDDDNPVKSLLFTPSGNTNLRDSGPATFTLSNQDSSITRRILVTVAGHASPL